MTAPPEVAAAHTLSFDEANHIYRANGRIVPSVTGIIGAAFGDLVWPFKSDFAMQRGSLVHKALHLWITGDLDVAGLSSYVAGFVAAGIAFLHETSFEVQASERRLYSEIYDYAGTLDIVGQLDRKLTIADWKTGDPGYAAGPQTWAYSQAWQEETGEVVRQRLGVWLHEDGSYNLIPYKNNREDQADFLAARRVLARRELLNRKAA